MHIDVPLNKLRFGHEDGGGINARVTGRDDGIAALAANLYAQGQIEDLIVKPCGDGLYSVANGNRRLKAFHTIYGPENDRPIGCTLHDVDEAKAFEFSLTTAVTAAQLHPVDQYEAFAKLVDRDRTEEEIAQQYGMTQKQVKQALALGRLSPAIRDAWRSGAVNAEVAKAFTLGHDHKAQDKAYAKLSKQGQVWQSAIRDELGASGADIGELLDFVGADRYRDSGGTVVEDLFGSSHVVSDAALLKELATDKLNATCEHLRSEGWSWAQLRSDLPQGAKFWSRSQAKSIAYEGDDEKRIAELKTALAKIDSDEETSESYNRDFEDLRRPLESELFAITMTALRRSFSDKQKAKAGCIVDLEDGQLIILFGVLKPEEKKPAAAMKGEEAVAGKVPAEEPAISAALVHRLTRQLTKAASTAMLQDSDLGLCVLLAGASGYDGSGVKISISGMGRTSYIETDEFPKVLARIRKLTPQQRNEMVAQYAAAALDFQNQPLDATRDDSLHGPRAVCDALNPKALNAALRGEFDAKDYFNGVNKALCLKAIEEACGPDLGRQQAKNAKAEIAKFAIANVPTTGWLPLQLRAKGYDGPPVANAKSTAATLKDKSKPPRVQKKALAKPAKSKAAKPVGKKAARKKPRR